MYHYPLTQHPGDEGGRVAVPGDAGDALHLVLGHGHDARVLDEDLPNPELDLRRRN